MVYKPEAVILVILCVPSKIQSYESQKVSAGKVIE